MTNDLDLIGEFRADLPPARPADLAAGRARLLTAMRPATSRRRTVRVLLPAGAVGTAAVAAVVFTLLGTTGAPPTPEPGQAARLLADASVVVSAQPDVEPAPGQWIYSDSISYTYPRTRTEYGSWTTFDGSEDAYVENGRLVTHHRPPAAPSDEDTPETSYAAMAALPTDPKAMLAYADKQVAGQKLAEVAASSPLNLYAARSTKAQLEFDYLAGLLWQSQNAAPPSAVAAVFSAMSTIPGISTQSVLDDSGTPTVAISANGGLTRMLLDPKTYRVRGAQSLSDGTNPAKPGNGKTPSTPWPPRGQIVSSLTLAQVALVSGPGKTS
jgi:hypothetical protein